MTRIALRVVADGTLARGARDVHPATCVNIWAAVAWRDGVQRYRPLGLPLAIATRELAEADGREELVWNYPGLGEVRMERICSEPDAHRG